MIISNKDKWKHVGFAEPSMLVPSEKDKDTNGTSTSNGTLLNAFGSTHVHHRGVAAKPRRERGTPSAAAIVLAAWNIRRGFSEVIAETGQGKQQHSRDSKILLHRRQLPLPPAGFG